MPSLRTFHVEFDRLDATYAAGDTVSGNIALDVAREKSIRGLYFSAKGEARVNWTETRKAKRKVGRGPLDNNANRIETYRNTEEYFHFKYNVIGSQKSEQRIQIPVGLHRYPFRFQLPRNIPNSFEHLHGRVGYTVKAVIDRPWKFDHECKAGFTVNTPLDLNMHRQKCLGIDDEEERKFCCFCCIDYGALSFRIKLPAAGYTPGESIRATLDYSNSSRSVRVTRVCTKLLRTLKFKSAVPSSKVRVDTAEVTSTRNNGPFPVHGNMVSELLIPPVPSSSLEYCNIIDMDYKLAVLVHVSGMHCKIEKHYPLLIGTIPLYCPPSAPPLDAGESGDIFRSTRDAREPATMPVAMPLPMTMPGVPAVPCPMTDGTRE